MDKKNVVILGMARSGTSFTASIFSKCNYHFATDTDKQLQKADKFNPSGYWESQHLLDANREILREAGYMCDNTWFYKDAISSCQVENLTKLLPMKKHIDLIEEYDAMQPWVWKDPRLCYTLGYWWPLLKDKNVIVLLVERDKNEIYNSFQRVTKYWDSSIEITKENVFDRIDSHVDNAYKIIKQYEIPCLTVNYSDYSNNPDRIVHSLKKRFGLDIKADELGYKRTANHTSLAGKVYVLVGGAFAFLYKALSKIYRSVFG